MKTEDITKDSKTKTIIICCLITLLIALTISFLGSNNKGIVLKTSTEGKKLLNDVKSQFNKMAAFDHYTSNS